MTLRYQAAAAHIYDKLAGIPRTGWVIRGVPNPETVYDHTVSVVKLAHTMQAELQLSDEALDDLTHILEIHDWAEADAGDEYIPNENQRSYEQRAALKHQREKAALKELVKNRPYEHTAMQLWKRYEEGSDPIATLAKELDKFQALALAAEYEDRYSIPQKSGLIQESGHLTKDC